MPCRSAQDAQALARATIQLRATVEAGQVSAAAQTHPCPTLHIAGCKLVYCGRARQPVVDTQL